MPFKPGDRVRWTKESIAQGWPKTHGAGPFTVDSIYPDGWPRIGGLCFYAGRFELDTPTAPPLGLEPRTLFHERIDRERMIDIFDAMQRYAAAEMPVPVGWLEEFKELWNSCPAKSNNCPAKSMTALEDY